MGPVLKHLRGNAVAYVALTVALGGTSYAATSLAPNSVGTRQVRDRSLLKRDFKRGQLPRGRRGVRGPAGPVGAAGPTGPRGPAGPLNPSATTVGGFAANELARTSRGSATTFFSRETFAGQATATIVAPHDGFVVVQGALYFETASDACNPCDGQARLRNMGNGEASPALVASVGDGTTTAHATPVSPVWVFGVEAGTHSFVLDASVVPARAAVSVRNPTVNATYVPFGASGGDTLAP